VHLDRKLNEQDTLRASRLGRTVLTRTDLGGTGDVDETTLEASLSAGFEIPMAELGGDLSIPGADHPRFLYAVTAESHLLSYHNDSSHNSSSFKVAS
jgi:hypothetical protein